MVIDTSVVIAILLRETEAGALLEAVLADHRRFLPAPALVEAAAVMLARKGPQGEIALDALLQRLDIRIVPMSPAAAAHARFAYRRYGKGVGSPGVLNFGECLVYGVCKETNEPLLFKGDDFSKTDLVVVA